MGTEMVAFKIGKVTKIGKNNLRKYSERLH